MRATASQAGRVTLRGPARQRRSRWMRISRRRPSFVSASPDVQPPVVADCMPVPGSIQVARNTLVILHLCDEGRGVDAGSVSISVNGSLVYAGDVERYRSSLGVCQRAGTTADYTYAYQQSKPFAYDAQVVVSVAARDLAGNPASGQTYSFATEMHAFGAGRKGLGGTDECDPGQACRRGRRSGRRLDRLARRGCRRAAHLCIAHQLRHGGCG